MLAARQATQYTAAERKEDPRMTAYKFRLRRKKARKSNAKKKLKAKMAKKRTR